MTKVEMARSARHPGQDGTNSRDLQPEKGLGRAKSGPGSAGWRATLGVRTPPAPAATARRGSAPRQRRFLAPAPQVGRCRYPLNRVCCERSSLPAGIPLPATSVFAPRNDSMIRPHRALRSLILLRGPLRPVPEGGARGGRFDDWLSADRLGNRRARPRGVGEFGD
jgi:hypothetical protein